ncbi:MAG: MBL fold metallo-hydrolase, partial [Clostridia bacterium]|nr:MBL fold metallo-hydrolase [Clostridia bacterium]
MKLTWFSTAAFLLREGDAAIAFDPFLGLPLGRRWPVLRGQVFREASAVFVTHGHVDHILELPALLAGSKAPIYATGTPCRTLQRHGVPAERLHRIGPGAAVDAGPFRVLAYQGRHCRFDGPLIRQTVPRLCRH